MSEGKKINTRDDGMCFGCGKLNKSGLRLNFEPKEDGVQAVFSPQRVHQGYIGITHGGIVATLLDEAMAQAAFKKGINPLTGELFIRYKKPVKTNEYITVKGRIKKKTGKLIYAEAEATEEDGQQLAFATGKLLKP